MLNVTRTHTTYFNRDQVDELVGAAYRELATDFELRREAMDRRSQIACEARLGLLRNTWLVLLDEAG